MILTIYNNMISYFQKFTATINKWIGKKVDYDNAFWNQCTDFARKYCSDVGRPIWNFSGSAYNWWKTGSPFNSKWKRVQRQGNNFPSAWDVVFFVPTPKNKYGHVTIANNNCTESILNIIEQNAGSGNWDWKWNNAISKRTTNYSLCAGWYTYIW